MRLLPRLADLVLAASLVAGFPTQGTSQDNACHARLIYSDPSNLSNPFVDVTRPADSGEALCQGLFFQSGDQHPQTHCPFVLQACLDRSASECFPTSAKRTIRVRGSCPGLGKLKGPTIGSNDLCGPIAVINVPTDLIHNRSCKVRIIVPSGDSKIPADVQKLQLICKHPSALCASTTTSTTLPAPGSREYILDPCLPYQPDCDNEFSVNGDLDVYFNGVILFTMGDDSPISRFIGTIAFRALPGDQLTFVLRDTFGGCTGMPALYVEDMINGSLVGQGEPGIDLGCNRPAGNHGEVFRSTFTFPSL